MLVKKYCLRAYNSRFSGNAFFGWPAWLAAILFSSHLSWAAIILFLSLETVRLLSEAKSIFPASARTISYILSVASPSDSAIPPAPISVRTFLWKYGHDAGFGLKDLHFLLSRLRIISSRLQYHLRDQNSVVLKSSKVWLTFTKEEIIVLFHFKLMTVLCSDERNENILPMSHT